MPDLPTVSDESLPPSFPSLAASRLISLSREPPPPLNMTKSVTPPATSKRPSSARSQSPPEDFRFLMTSLQKCGALARGHFDANRHPSYLLPRRRRAEQKRA